MKIIINKVVHSARIHLLRERVLHVADYIRDEIHASLATEAGQIPVSVGRKQWDVLPAPVATGDMLVGDLVEARKWKLFGTDAFGRGLLALTTAAEVLNYIEADQLIALANAMIYKGVIDCSSNPNYPAADAGWTYIVSVAGKIGGVSGIMVDAGDMVICNTDATASGDQATVGTKWNVIEKNMVTPLVLALGGSSADLSAAQNGTVYKNGLALATRLDNPAATTDPTTANDSTQNYSVGSRWINVNAGLLGEWVLLDATAGAARWRRTSQATTSRSEIFTRFISPMMEALTWAAAQIFQTAITFLSTVSQAVTSAVAGATFNQSGTGDIAAFQDAGIATVRIPDQGGVVLVPQAGGFQSVDGLLGYDSVKARLVLKQPSHNYPVPIDPRNTCRNKLFIITYA